MQFDIVTILSIKTHALFSSNPKQNRYFLKLRLEHTSALSTGTVKHN
jgi:hypothetical protein